MAEENDDEVGGSVGVEAVTQHAQLVKPGNHPRLAGAPVGGHAAPVPSTIRGRRRRGDGRPERRGPHEDVGAVLDRQGQHPLAGGGREHVLHPGALSHGGRRRHRPPR